MKKREIIRKGSSVGITMGQFSPEHKRTLRDFANNLLMIIKLDNLDKDEIIETLEIWKELVRNDT